MTQVKHTPGPWVTDGTDVCQTNHGGLHVIAQMSVPICGDDDWQEVEKVNARLIASAPDLLLALSWLVGLKDKRPADYYEQKPLAWAAARAAIAKATGA